MLGGVLSMRLTLKVHELLLPAASVAVNVTTVVPVPETAVPGAGDWVIVILAVAVQLSLRFASER